MRKYLKGISTSFLGGLAGMGTSVAFGGTPDVRAFLTGAAIVLVLTTVKPRA